MKPYDYEEEPYRSPPGTSLLSAQMESNIKSDVPVITSEVVDTDQQGDGNLNSFKFDKTLLNAVELSSVRLNFLFHSVQVH